MRRVLLACTTAVAMVAALLSFTLATADAENGLVTDLGVEVQADKALATLTETITYTIVTTNFSLLSTGGTLTDAQTGVADIVAVSPPDGGSCSQSGNTLDCTLPVLDPGESVAMTVTVASSTEGSTTNTAEVQPPIGILDVDQADNVDSSDSRFSDGARLAPGECLETSGHDLCNTGDNDIIVTDFEQTTTSAPTPVCDTAPCPVVFVDFDKSDEVKGVAEVDLLFGTPDPPCRGIGDTPCVIPTISKDNGVTYQELPECESATQTECYVDIYKTKRGVWRVVVRLKTQDPLLPILS